MQRSVLVSCLVLLLAAGVVAQDAPLARFSFQTPGAVIVDETQTLFGFVSADVQFVPDPQFGTALRFGGDSAAFTLPSNPLLDMRVATIQLWVRIWDYHNADLIARATSALIRTGVPGGKVVYGIRLYADGRVTGLVTNDDPHFNSFTMAHSRPGEMSLGQWHRLDLRWNDEKVSLWLDGRMIDARHYKPIPVLGLSYSDCGDFYVGQSLVWTDVAEMRADIARLTIYSRPLLDEEIRQGFAIEKAALGR